MTIPDMLPKLEAWCATIGGKNYPIRTLKQLARVIVVGNRREAVES